jgi:hypothetical protein
MIDTILLFKQTDYQLKSCAISSRFSVIELQCYILAPYHYYIMHCCYNKLNITKLTAGCIFGKSIRLPSEVKVDNMDRISICFVTFSSIKKSVDTQIM